MFNKISRYSKPLKFILSFFFLTFITLISPNIANAYDPAFAWDANTEPDLAGYYIYYKTGASAVPYNCTGADEGNSPIQIPIASLSDPANPQYTIHGLSDTETFYFVITAYDIYNNESSPSNELSNQPIALSANDDWAITSEDSPFTNINVISNDNFGSYGPASADICIITDPGIGTASVNNGNTPNDPTDDSIDYTPSLNPDGRNTLSYEIFDSEGICTTVLLTIAWDTLTYEICNRKGDCDTALLTIEVVTPVDQTLTFSGLSIRGDDFVNDSSNANYTAEAIFSHEGQTVKISLARSAGWSVDSAYASINSTGMLTTSAISGDQTVTIQAGYTYNGVTKTAIKEVTIIDVSAFNPSPRMPIFVSPENGQQ